MKVNEHNLLETLKAQKIDAKVQKETNQIYFLFKHEDHEFPLFIRLLHEGELIQLLTFIPCRIENKCENDLSRFLHMLNKELDMPGFCLDEASSTVFYRLMMPTLRQEFSQEVLEAYVNTSQTVCKSFATVIVALASGAMTLEEIIKKASDLQQ